MRELLNKTIVYTDWNIMMDRTRLDIEFLEAFNIKYQYRILIGDSRIEVEFICTK